MKLSLGGTGSRRKSGYSKRRKTLRRGKRFLPAVKSAFSRVSSFFPPIPARLQMSFRNVNYDDVVIPAAERFLYKAQRLYEGAIVTGVGGITFAGGIPPMFLMYNKMLVRKVVCKTTVTAMGQTDGGADADRFVTEVVFAVIPSSQAVTATDPVNISRLGSIPNANVKHLGLPQGGHDSCSDYRTVDVEQFAGQPLTINESLLRASNNTQVTGPNNFQSAALPIIIIGLTVPQGQAAAAYRFFITYDYTFHCEFDDIRAMEHDMASVDLAFVNRPN